MPSVSADAEASALSEFVARLAVGDKPADMTWGDQARLCSRLPRGSSGASLLLAGQG